MCKDRKIMKINQDFLNFLLSFQVCFSDTDSLCYFIKEGDITSYLATIRQYMDFSNYNESHPLYFVENKCIPGK